jgi:hypothetical protein
MVIMKLMITTTISSSNSMNGIDINAYKIVDGKL